ncbi:tRNA-dihydrouridine synthase [Natronorarus salvus]|uniref:tRNA-dihydrouridine synthase n=1 Tax=Natronorarus salvus TaxID=3117733 RepID=UPI002F2639D2
MFSPRVALASLSGRSDAGWALAVGEYVGCAFLGGIALDRGTRAAARELTERDREEFLPRDPIAFVEEQFAALSGTEIRPGFNVRASDPEPIREVATVCADHGAICEINAHCRQAEMCDAGAGESLLRDGNRLTEQVETASETGAAVSVKVRAEVSAVDLADLARRIERAGADAIHVDAMDSEYVIRDVSRACDLFVIANNGVRDRETTEEYLAFGADAVSVGRASDDPRVLTAVRETTDRWFEREVTA